MNPPWPADDGVVRVQGVMLCLCGFLFAVAVAQTVVSSYHLKADCSDAPWAVQTVEGTDCRPGKEGPCELAVDGARGSYTTQTCVKPPFNFNPSWGLQAYYGDCSLSGGCCVPSRLMGGLSARDGRCFSANVSDPLSSSWLFDCGQQLVWQCGSPGCHTNDDCFPFVFLGLCTGFNVTVDGRHEQEWYDITCPSQPRSRHMPRALHAPMSRPFSRNRKVR
jgi:hypothetical protein